MKVFFTIWFGQLISTLGSGLTGFGLGVWVYQQTGSTTLLALNMLAAAVPGLIVSPFAGALVDRWDRRIVMILSDCGAGLGTLAIALLLLTGKLEIWHIFVTTAFISAFSAFQWPAYSAATTLLVPKEQLGRASGMVQIGDAISGLISPALAGVLLVAAGLDVIVLIDFATFLFALATLALVRFPRPERSAESEANRGSLLKEAGFGWKYIRARKGLFGLLTVFTAANFLGSLTAPLFTPLLLSVTTPDGMGMAASIAGAGMLLGTLVMSAWGGPKRRIHGVLAFLIVGGVFTALMGLRPSLTLITIAGFFSLFLVPIINGSSQAIWQSKVAPDVQGRVFSVRRMIAWGTNPLAYLLAGPLNDQVFRPLLVDGGALAGTLGRVIGTGPGRGTGLMLIVTGLLTMVLVTVLGYLNTRVRRVELEIPDQVPDRSGPPAETARAG
jgi:MFS family permease